MNPVQQAPSLVVLGGHTSVSSGSLTPPPLVSNLVIQLSLKPSLSAHVFNFPWFQIIPQMFLRLPVSNPSSLYLCWFFLLFLPLLLLFHSLPLLPILLLGRPADLQVNESWSVKTSWKSAGFNAVSRCDCTNVWMSTWNELERDAWGSFGVRWGEQEDRMVMKGYSVRNKWGFKKRFWKLCEKEGGMNMASKLYDNLATIVAIFYSHVHTQNCWWCWGKKIMATHPTVMWLKINERM